MNACHTAVGDKKVPEESVSLDAGMLAVGFEGVVATMWSFGEKSQGSARESRIVTRLIFGVGGIARRNQETKITNAYTRQNSPSHMSSVS